MSRLPIPGGDNGTWGDILNDFLVQAHNGDGTLKNSTVSAPTLTAIGGVTGQVLTNDTAVTGGIKWSTPVTGGAPSGPAGGDLAGTYPNPTVPGLAGKEPSITAGTTAQYWRGDKTWQTLDKTAVGLANVDNTSDVTKNAAAVSLTNKNLTSGTNTFPTFNQNTTGTAATATTANALNSATTTVVVNGAAAPGSGQVLTATSGTAANWQTPAAGYVNPMTTLGDMIYENSTPAATRLAGDTTGTKKFLTQTGNGTISAAPGWAVIVAGDVPTLNQNTTGSAAKWTTPRNLAGNSVDGSADVAFTNKFIVQGTSDAGLTGAQFLGALTTGIMTVATTTGVVSSVTAPAGAIVGTTDTQTMTNKRRQPRVFSTASTATLTPECDTYDLFHLTAQAAALTIANHSTSTPSDGEQIRIRILDNGVARAVSFGTNYVAKGGIALPTTTVLSKNMEMGFEWNANLSKWNLLALAQEA